MKKIKFEELMLSREMQKAISDLGFEEATPIQSEAIPVLLERHDAIGQAQTGTGKTAAFGIPAIEMLNKSDKNLQAVVLCPTRELAIQVAEEMSKLAKYKKDVCFLPVYGGQPIERQLKALKKGVQVVIGTPGRVMDHMERGTIDLSQVKLIVLDEADEMLDMGFRDDIEFILKNTPKSRQTVMFSATMPKPILELTKKYLKSPKNIKVVHEVLTVPNTEQIYYEIKEKNKLEALCRVIDLYNLKLALVFSNTKRGVDELVEHLQARGYSADGLHGDMKQSTREKVMGRFRKGSTEILVATDVAARGLDVDNVEAVFNYDMPQDEEYYVHRIGRTGRAGKSGKAFTFVTGRELYKLKDIQKYTKTKLKLNPIPSFDDVEEVRVNLFFDTVKKTIDEGSLKKYANYVKNLLDEEYNSLDIAAALVKMNLFQERSTSDSNNGEIENDKVKGGSLRPVRLFLNVGKKDKIRPGDILGAIAGETGIPGKVIGEIDMYDKFSFVNVPEKYVDEILDIMQDNQIRGKRINIEVANKKS
ncbi:MAG: DEAD/DEAH box helicase [Bacteroidota bacterium]|nr:DEAD/DEAH box helicase [Bacteroidota bacterium]MDP4191514.1 DEAD/DEAH box helicase [Bacteroidota bacterium]MDP4195258.1 DEAD/DEAH box helicase [Bacteroidota bacterium]